MEDYVIKFKTILYGEKKSIVMENALGPQMHFPLKTRVYIETTEDSMMPFRFEGFYSQLSKWHRQYWPRDRAHNSKISHAHNYTQILRNASDGKCWESKRIPWFPQTFTEHLLRAPLGVRAWGYTDTQGTATALTGLTAQRGRDAEDKQWQCSTVSATIRSLQRRLGDQRRWTNWIRTNWDWRGDVGVVLADDIDKGRPCERACHVC